MLGRTVFGVLARPCVVAVTITLFLFQHALAQTPTGAQLSSPGARVILLGTGGGPILRKGRSQPASLLVIDGAAYLIDAGDGVSRQMTLAEVPGTTLRAVFLTHLHLDHTAGLPSLIGFHWMDRLTHPRLPPLAIYGPPGTDRMIDAAANFLGIPSQLFRNAQSEAPPVPVTVAAHVVRPGLIYSDERVKVSAVENTHYAEVATSAPPYGRDASYSLRFDTKYGSVVFSGDTGPSDALAALAQGADILVCEINDVTGTVATLRTLLNLPPEALDRWVAHMEHEHLSPDEVGKLASRAGVKMVVLTHFSTLGEVGSDMVPWTGAVRKYFKGSIVPGKDLDEYDLD